MMKSFAFVLILSLMICENTVILATPSLINRDLQQGRSSVCKKCSNITYTSYGRVSNHLTIFNDNNLDFEFEFIHISPIDTGYVGAQPFVGTYPFKFGVCTDTQLNEIELKQRICLKEIGFEESKYKKQTPLIGASNFCSVMSKLKQCNYIVDGETCLNKNEKEQYYVLAHNFVKVAEGLCANNMKNLIGLGINGSKCLANAKNFMYCFPDSDSALGVFLKDVNNGFCKMATCLDFAFSACTADTTYELKSVIDGIKDVNRCPDASNSLFHE